MAGSTWWSWGVQEGCPGRSSLARSILEGTEHHGTSMKMCMFSHTLLQTWGVTLWKSNTSMEHPQFMDVFSCWMPVRISHCHVWFPKGPGKSRSWICSAPIFPGRGMARAPWWHVRPEVAASVPFLARRASSVSRSAAEIWWVLAPNPSCNAQISADAYRGHDPRWLVVGP